MARRKHTTNKGYTVTAVLQRSRLVRRAPFGRDDLLQEGVKGIRFRLAFPVIRSLVAR